MVYSEIILRDTDQETQILVPQCDVWTWSGFMILYNFTEQRKLWIKANLKCIEGSIDMQLQQDVEGGFSLVRCYLLIFWALGLVEANGSNRLQRFPSINYRVLVVPQSRQGMAVPMAKTRTRWSNYLSSGPVTFKSLHKTQVKIS